VAPAKISDPTRLKRERAGRYVSGDGRFAVESQSAGTWYVIDTERQNELGLPLMEGPFETLDAARDEVEALRAGRSKSANAQTSAAESAPAPARPALRAIAGGASKAKPRAAGAESSADDGAKGAATTPKAKRERPSPGDESAEPAWIRRLADADAKEARRLLAILERAGIDDPMVARRELEADVPEVASTLLARRVQESLTVWKAGKNDKEVARARMRELSAAVPRHLRDEIDEALDGANRVIDGTRRDADIGALAWLVALRTAADVFKAIDAEGREKRATGEPGWRLMELDGKRQPTNRQITIDESDLMEPLKAGARDST
jgi:hypothetical protein